jgi:DNA mismatch repair protein MutS2
MDEKSQQILEFSKIKARLASYTSFSAGEALALALTPTADLQEARRWQTETSEARRLLDSHSEATIGGARDVRRPADNARRGFILPPEELLNIRATLIAARNLRRTLERLAEQFPQLAQIADLIEDCPGLVTAVGQTFDERGEVMDSASSKLANLRQQLRVAHGRIQEKLRSLVNSSMNQYLQEPIISLRSGRYVVPLKADAKGRIRGIVHDQSGSGATLWVEPLNTVDLNNEHRRLMLEEQEEIERILAALSQQVAEQAEPLKRIVARMAELDLIFARARYANEMKAVEPAFVEWQPPAPPRPPKHANERAKWQPLPFNPHPGSTIWLKGARHPLLDPESVVPTDITLDTETFILLITGPNTGGKTVSLKTVGLLALMAQAGLHLPAVEARLTLFENIFADIGDEQSIEQSLSTFSGHISNIIRILAQVTDRSLVLIDELGSGTDPTEGAALAQSIVSFLRDKGATTFVATHYPELKLYASETVGATNASLLFDLETLAPTYEMSIGLPGRSNAFAIARRLGLDETILDEARALVGHKDARAEDMLAAIHEMQSEINAKEAAVRLNLGQIEMEREELRRRLANIETERQKVLAETHQEAQTRLTELQEELRRLRKRLRGAAEAQEIEKELAELQEEQEALIPEAAPVDRPVMDPNRPLQLEDIVLVKLLNTEGKIIDINGQEAVVAVGRLHMRSKLRDLAFVRREDAAVETVSLPVSGGSSPGMELDLRGKRVDEGLELLEKYLDNAFLANLPWVRIIHGKGTGKLRQAVRRALQQHAHVASWEEGKDGEGDTGVTVVKF